MKKRLLSLALCLVLVVGLFSGLTVNASAGKIDDLKAWKKKIAEKIIDNIDTPVTSITVDVENGDIVLK